MTIPKAIRGALEIDEGTAVEFELDGDGRTTVRPKRPAMDRLRDVERRLSRHDVDLEATGRESKRTWSGHVDGDESARS